jgi:uncharacterized membrane protein YkvA (DUF1232 family)
MRFWFIMRLAAKAPRRRRPVSSTLGITQHPPFEPMQLFDKVRHWAEILKRDAMTLWFASKHPKSPWQAKALGAFVVAYALSPIDLIPDFIPLLGLLDDLILLPVLIWLALKLLPAEVLRASRSQASDWIKESKAKPKTTLGAVVIAMIWAVLALGLAAWLYSRSE